MHKNEIIQNLFNEEIYFLLMTSIFWWSKGITHNGIHGGQALPHPLYRQVLPVLDRGFDCMAG